MQIQAKHCWASSAKSWAWGLLLFASVMGLGAEEPVDKPLRMTYLDARLQEGRPVFGMGVIASLGTARISELFESGPASKAGLQLGDTLLSADGVALSGKTQVELLNVLMEKSARTFRVRDADGREREVRVVKAVPETFADAEKMITVRRMDLSLSGIAIGQTPPDFTALDGAKLHDTKGKPVVVIFWATWCLPCMAEVPALKKLYAEFHPRGVEFMGVSLDDDRARLDQYLAEQGMTWSQNFDGKGWENAVAQQWGVVGVPALVLLGRDGRAVEKKVPLDKLRERLEEALK